MSDKDAEVGAILAIEERISRYYFDISSDQEYSSVKNQVFIDLQTLLIVVRKCTQELAEAKASVCNTCAGSPISGKPCICGGVGTQAAELQGFREMCFSMQAVVDAAKKHRSSLEDGNAIGLDETGYALADALDDLAKLNADQPLRCLKSGNPCGTDTHHVDHPCKCENCQRLIDEIRMSPWYR